VLPACPEGVEGLEGAERALPPFTQNDSTRTAPTAQTMERYAQTAPLFFAPGTYQKWLDTKTSH
jgi:hypothetical protein